MQSTSRFSHLLTVEEYAAATGYQPASIRQMVWRRQIDFLKIGRNIRFTEDMVQRIRDQALVPARTA